ncbi:MAG: hypothetical protein AB9866_04695 [Syntrophobacteraceae bacterium]
MRVSNKSFLGRVLILALIVCGAHWEIAWSSDSNPDGIARVVIPREFQPSSTRESGATGADTLYFTPQDENSSCTVLFLYNTGDTDKLVALQTFRLNGDAFIDTAINVPAHRMVRICSDEVSSFSPSWQSVVLINFTTYSAYAKMTLPAGVRAGGYVAWNNASYYDPGISAPTLKLRLTADNSRNSTVYLTPQDEDTSCTILFLYNTSSVDANVPLQTFDLNGSKYIDTAISVPAHQLVRISSDEVSTVSASWQNAVLVDFTASSTYAKMTLPAGVKVDGYIAWNGENPYDPIAVVHSLEMGFSFDPSSSDLSAVNLLLFD